MLTSGLDIRRASLPPTDPAPRHRAVCCRPFNHVEASPFGFFLQKIWNFLDRSRSPFAIGGCTFRALEQLRRAPSISQRWHEAAEQSAGQRVANRIVHVRGVKRYEKNWGFAVLNARIACIDFSYERVAANSPAGRETRRAGAILANASLGQMEETAMILVSALAASFATMISIAAFAQESRSFLPDPSGGFSRTVFETDVSPDFKITIRDFAFPPDRQPRAVSLPSSAFVHLLSGGAAISIARKPVELPPGARSPVPAGAPIEVMNNSENPVVIKALVIEAK